MEELHLEYQQAYHLDVEQIHLDEKIHQRQQGEVHHLDEMDHQHQQDVVHLDEYLIDQVDPCLDSMRKDCCQVLPLGEEFPCPEPQQKDCYLDEEYLELALLELQVQLALLVQPLLPELLQLLQP